MDLRSGKMTGKDVVAQCRDLASLGIQHAIFNMPEVDQLTPLEIFGKEIIPEVAGF